MCFEGSVVEGRVCYRVGMFWGVIGLVDDRSYGCLQVGVF